MIESRYGHFFDARNISQSESDNIRTHVQRKDGQLWLFVHPFFPMSDPVWENLRPEARDHKAKELEFLGKTRFPVIILEEEAAMEVTRIFVASKKPVSNFVIVPTADQNPLPLIITKKATINDQWNALFDLIRSIGAESIFIGGRLYDGINGGCIYETEKQLKKAGFETFLTELCFPINPLD